RVFYCKNGLDFTLDQGLGDRGRGKLRLKGLAPGEYECAVTKLEASDGVTLCEGAFLTRTVTVE
ncbi:MAG: hypothetical protein KJ057_16205, partial [Phycisphaerae bacterium]|nr:hypothetical protein [Phycisphaerae bacterium]